jgi:CheY-like chemotaxis protein
MSSDSASSSEPPLPAGNGRSRRTVLLVDDDDDFRLALADSLTADGCDVLDAASGEAALAILDDAAKAAVPSPDLLVLDLLMPGMSGTEVLHRMRKSHRWAKLPVLVVTAVNDQMLPVRLDLPIAFKPDPDTVLDAVRQQLAAVAAPHTRPAK